MNKKEDYLKEVRCHEMGRLIGMMLKRSLM